MTANHSPTYVRTSKKNKPAGTKAGGAQQTRTATIIPPHTRDDQAERHAQGARRGSGNNRVVKRQNGERADREEAETRAPTQPQCRGSLLRGAAFPMQRRVCMGSDRVVVGQNGGVEPVGGLLFCTSLFLRIRLRSKEHRRSSTGTTRSSVVAAIAAQQSLLGSCYTILHMFAGGLVSRQDTPESTNPL